MSVIRDLLKGIGYLLIVFAAIKVLALLGVTIFGQGRNADWIVKQVKWTMIFATGGFALTRIRQPIKQPDNADHESGDSN